MGGESSGGRGYQRGAGISEAGGDSRGGRGQLETLDSTRVLGFGSGQQLRFVIKDIYG